MRQFISIVWIGNEAGFMSHHFALSQLGTHPAMECFFHTPVSRYTDTPIVVTANPVDGQNRKRGKVDQSPVGRDASGIKISLLPKRRASIENAPGPRQTIEIAMVTAKATAILASNRFGEGV